LWLQVSLNYIAAKKGDYDELIGCLYNQPESKYEETKCNPDPTPYPKSYYPYKEQYTSLPPVKKDDKKY
jgi:hypothetical protein